MSLSVIKGQKISNDTLKQENDNKILGKVSLVLEWMMKTGLGGDVDLSAPMLGADGMMWAKNAIVYYNRLASEDGAVRHHGDAAEGVTGEQILISLPEVDSKTKTIIAAISAKPLEPLATGPFHLANLSSATLKLLSHEGDRTKVLCTYDLKDELGKNSAAVMARLSRDGDGWSFEPVGQPLGEGKNANGIVDILRKYSIWYRRGDITDIVLDKLTEATPIIAAAAVPPVQTPKPQKTSVPVPPPPPPPATSFKWLWWLLLLPLLGLLWWGLSSKSCSRAETPAAPDTVEVAVAADTVRVLTPAEQELDKDLMLHAVHFTTSLSRLAPDEKEFLDRVVAALKANPDIKLIVQGHTDNVDTDEVNIPLSASRAQKVADYLVQAGIDAARLEAKGFGSTKPVAGNDTPEGRAKNRRVDFTIVR